MPSKINIHDLLRLASIPGIGSSRLRSLIARFHSPAEVFKTPAKELLRAGGIDRKLASLIVHSPPNEEFVDDQLSRINKVNGKILTLWDDHYPDLLKKIYDPPAVLFVRGTLQPEDKFAVAIVGTRHPTQYGKLHTERFAQELCAQGVTIVSGLARGIDTIAHASAIKNGGRTIAVIGSGIDHIYPAENKKLADQIEETGSGAVISEFFMGTKPDPGNFPRRNRIISGMSLGTLIVESDEGGGAMITGTTTIDQNRELFCIPGNIGEKNSNGTNKLIKQGQAKLVQTVDDIIEELESPLRPILRKAKRKPGLPSLTIFEQKIFDVLTESPTHIDVISEKTGFSPSDTLVTLLGLEFKSVINQLPGKYFVRL